MDCLKRNVLSIVQALFSLTLAPAINAESLAPQSTPEIDVFVYGFPGFSPWVLEGAEAEAMRLLLPARIALKWIDCTRPPVSSASCYSPQGRHELVVLFRAKALPLADSRALGMASPSSDGGAAFIFYNRVIALQTSLSLFHVMLGRVLAHEITHLLLPGEHHSDSGLMRADWISDDLRFTSTAYFGLSPRSIQLMQKEVRRRALARERSSVAER